MPLFGPNIENMRRKGDIEGLIDLVIKNNWMHSDITNKAVEALVAIGKGVIPRVGAKLLDGRAEYYMIKILCEIGGAEIQPYFSAYLEKTNLFSVLNMGSSSSEMIDLLKALGWKFFLPFLSRKTIWIDRVAAVEILGGIGDKQAIESLSPLVKDRKKEVREAAAKAINDLGWMPAPSPPVPEQAYALISAGKWQDVLELGVAAIEPLIATMMNKKEKLAVRYDALEYLGYLFHHLTHGQERCIQALVAALEDANLNWKALLALGHTRSSLALEPVIKEFKRGRIERKWLIMALSDLNDARAFPELLPYLEDPNAASAVKEGIRLTLLDSASTAAESDLRAIIKVKDLMKPVYGYEAPESMGVESSRVVIGSEVQMDFSEIRNLAEKELSRRGLRP